MPREKRKKYYRDEQFLQKVGARIRAVRISKNLSQEALAFECDYADYSQINRIELGKVNFSISYLNLIADKLEVNLNELLLFD